MFILTPSPSRARSCCLSPPPWPGPALLGRFPSPHGQAKSREAPTLPWKQSYECCMMQPRGGWPQTQELLMGVRVSGWRTPGSHPLVPEVTLLWARYFHTNKKKHHINISLEFCGMQLLTHLGRSQSSKSSSGVDSVTLQFEISHVYI